MASTLQRGTELTLTVTDAAFEGKSISRLDNFVIFIDGAVPGDTVTARITKVKAQFAEAVVTSVLTPSPDRVTPRCPHVGVCGGCKWQHLEYSRQLIYKHQQVVDAFERIGGIEKPVVLPILGSDSIFFYRNKMEYSFAEQEWLTAAEMAARETPSPNGVYLGLHVPQRYDKVLDIRECHLQSDVSNIILTTVREYARKSGLAVYNSENESGYWRFLVIRHAKQTGQLMVNVVTSIENEEMMRGLAAALLAAAPSITTIVNTINRKKAQIAFGDTELVYHGEGSIFETLGRHRYRISASSFFQTNTAQAERLYDTVKKYAALTGNETVYDFYCGTGSIAIHCSDEARRVIGIESVESAVRDAERNAALNEASNCSFLIGDLKDLLTRDAAWQKDVPPPDVVVLDPPRSGVHEKALEAVIRLAPPRIVYVSCNPATQARDAKLLCASAYKLVEMQPVDMFPHTFHIENVALFVRN